MAGGAARASMNQPGPGKDELARYVYRLVSDSRQALQEQHESWFYQITFWRGFQWSYRDRNVGRLMHVPASPWRIRVTDNQVRPLIQHMLALLIEKRPTFKAIARNNEEEDLLAALGFEALLSYDWERLELTQLLSSAVQTMLVTGNGFLRAAWNPRAGVASNVPVQTGDDTMAAKVTPEPEGDEKEIDDPVGQEDAEVFQMPGVQAERPEPTILEQLEYEGDIDVQVVSPFNMNVDLTATSIRDAKWIAQEAYIDRNRLVDLVGKKAEDLVSDVSSDEFYAYDKQLRFDSGATSITGDDEQTLIRVVEFWEAPTKKHPKGRVITVAGGITLSEKVNPYGGRFPYVHLPCFTTPGRFWGEGVVRELIPLQQMHNKAISRYHEIMMLSSNPKWIVDKETGIKETSINDRPGEIIFKKRGGEVSAVSPPPPSPIFPQVMSLAMNAMQTITGVNDPLAGNNPPNVRAGVTVKFLQEAGMRRFTPIALQVEAGLRSLGKMMMYLHQRYTSEDRAFAILGRDSLPEVHHLKRASIDRIVDVTIVQGSLIPKSPAAQQELLIQLLQYLPQLFQDGNGQIDTEYIFQVLDMPTASGQIGLKRRQRMRAYNEHILAEEGKQITVLPFDDDDLHLQIHAARMSDDRWVDEQPEGAKALMEHYTAHEQNKQMKMMGAMANIHAPSQAASGPGGSPVSPGGAQPPPGGSGAGGGFGGP